MEITIDNYKEMLVAPGHITQEQLLLCAEKAKARNVSLDTVFIEEGLITDKNLGRTIADFF